MKTEIKQSNPVKFLRLMGCKVKVNHWRFYDVPVLGGSKRELALQGPRISTGIDIPDDVQPSPRGGQTVVTVTSPSGWVYRGIAKCSLKDNYCKRSGVAYCLDRLKPLDIAE